MYRRAALLLTLALLGGGHVHAQGRPEGSPVAVGGQVGSFGGLTVRLPARTPQSFVVAVVVGDATVLGSAARQFETRLPGSPLRVFVAPGLYGGAEDGAGAAGLLALVGVGFYAQRFDVYLQAVPGLRVLPRARVFVRAAAGLRYAL